MRGNRDHLQGLRLLPLSFSILKSASVLNTTLSTLNNTGALHLTGGRTYGTRRSGVQTLEPDRLGACPLLLAVIMSKLPNLSVTQFRQL